MATQPPDDEVLKSLGHYVEAHPGTADTLATNAFTNELEAASALPVAQADEEFLKIVRDFLTRIFKMVQKELGRPVVLPGFLTGTGYLAVIDVRTVPPGGQLELPRIGGQNPPTIMLWESLAPVGVQHWMPRLWLVKATDADRHEYEDLARDPDTTPEQFADALKDQPFVTGITRHHVVVKHAQMVAKMPPVTMGETGRISWAQSPDGVKAMLAALTSQLGERQQQDLLWIQALASA